MAVKTVKEERAKIEYSKDWWSEKIAKHLVGRKIIKIDYMDKEETKEFGWSHSAVNIYLDNDGGTPIVLSPMRDDEGNDAGAIATNIKDLETIPVWFGGSEREV